MRILADCGSTSCKWVLEGQAEPFSGPGINPSVMSDHELKSGFEQNGILFSSVEKEKVSEVYFFGAGCLNTQVNKKVNDWLRTLFPNASLHVESDLYGACLAVYQNAPTATGILGTGSAAAGFNGNTITRLTPSLGYQLADEGAGSYIGRQLLLAYLYAELPKDLSDAFYMRFPETETDWVIQKVYTEQAGSAFLAKYTQLAIDFAEHPYIRETLSDAFSLFIRRHFKPLLSAGFEHAGIIGSVGFGFQDVLKPLLLQAGFKSVTFEQNTLHSLQKKMGINNKK